MTIETKPVELDENYAAVHQGVKPGKYIMLSVSDTGYGMDEATQMQIFEPFFTTKGNKGTGLGLATVYGIIKQHGGNIWVYSEPGRGTTFKVYLPVSEKINVGKNRAEKTFTNLKGSETIMIVEDNEDVRNIAEGILRQHGYTTLIGKDGMASLEILSSYDGPVHMLLTDVIMPEMNGKELHAKVVEKYPAMKVLFMSGYTDNIIGHHGVLDEGKQFIQKPLTVQALAAKVREVLDN